MYFEVRRDGVGGWAEILLSDQNSQNGTIIVLTVTFVLVIMDEVFIYQYIVNNNTFILLVFWLQMMLPLNTLSHDTLVRFCFFFHV